MGATGSIWDAAQGASTKLGCPPSEEAQHSDAPKSTPPRRVVAKPGVCSVAPLGNGTTIACAVRLASIPVWRQRIPRIKSDRLLGSGTRFAEPEEGDKEEETKGQIDRGEETDRNRRT